MRLLHRCLPLTVAACAFAAVVALPQPVPAASTTADDHVKKVIAVSVDGLNPRAIRKLGRDGAPNLHAMMRQGASTLNARTTYERTNTLPNHTGMLTGRQANPKRGGHGITFNHDPGSTVHAAAGAYVASVFDVVHDGGRRTALYTGKDKFALLDRSWGPDAGELDTTGTDQGRDKIDTYRYRADSDVLVDDLLADIADGPSSFTFLHLAEPDQVGHEFGYMGPEYLAAITDADARVGAVLAAVRARPVLAHKTVVLLTSDHGGRGYEHSDPARAANYTVPFLAWGSGVARDVNLYRLNPAYAGPGKTRPTYAPSPQPIRNLAVANLVTDLLDLPRVPGSTGNSRQDLEIFPVG